MRLHRDCSFNANVTIACDERFCKSLGFVATSTAFGVGLLRHQTAIRFASRAASITAALMRKHVRKGFFRKSVAGRGSIFLHGVSLDTHLLELMIYGI